jgi:hypothetical protein
MTKRQLRQLNQKRAQQDTWTVVLFALLLASLLVIKFAVNTAFQHDLAEHNKQVQQ